MTLAPYPQGLPLENRNPFLWPLSGVEETGRAAVVYDSLLIPSINLRLVSQRNIEVYDRKLLYKSIVSRFLTPADIGKGFSEHFQRLCFLKRLCFLRYPLVGGHAGLWARRALCRDPPEIFGKWVTQSWTALLHIALGNNPLLFPKAHPLGRNLIALCSYYMGNIGDNCPEKIICLSGAELIELSSLERMSPLSTSPGMLAELNVYFYITAKCTCIYLWIMKKTRLNSCHWLAIIWLIKKRRKMARKSLSCCSAFPVVMGRGEIKFNEFIINQMKDLHVIFIELNK